MKRIFTALVMALSFNAVADEMVCESYGYAPTAEGFHTIKTEPYVTEFEITPYQVIKKSIGKVFKVVDPSTVGLGGLDIIVYQNSGDSSVLYLYKNQDKPEIGISAMVQDSDALFEDKDLFADCGFVEQKGEDQRAVASKLSFKAKASGVNYSPSLYHF